MTVLIINRNQSSVKLTTKTTETAKNNPRTPSKLFSSVSSSKYFERKSKMVSNATHRIEINERQKNEKLVCLRTN